MTSPRIETNTDALYSLDSLMCEGEPAINSAPTPQPEADSPDFIDQVQDYASDAADYLYDNTLGEGVAAGEAALHNAGKFAEVGSDIKALEDGDTAIVEIGVGISFHEGVGGGAKGGFQMAVTRDQDSYEALVEVSRDLAVGFGAEAAKQGVSLDATVGNDQRLVVRGNGPAARDELAALADITNPGKILDTLQNSEHLQIARIEGNASVGFAGGAGAVVSASTNAEVTAWAGVEFKDGLPNGAIQRTEVALKYEVSTPRVQLGTSADEAAMLDALPNTLGGDGLAFLVEKTGISPGLKLQAEGTLSVETRGNVDTGFEQQLEMKTRVRAGATALESTQKASINVSEISADKLRHITSANTEEEFLSRLEAAGIEVESSTRVLETKGVEVDLPFVNARRGVESTVQSWEFGGAIR